MCIFLCVCNHSLERDTTEAVAAFWEAALGGWGYCVQSFYIFGMFVYLIQVLSFHTNNKLT